MRISAKASFVIAVVLLGCCAMGLEGATRFLKLHFRKERVELAQPIESVPAKLGAWVQVTPDSALKEDEEHILGTNQYLMRVYVNTAVVAPSLVQGLKDDPDKEHRDSVIGAIMAQQPDAVMSFMLTYYTGMADTVAHVPDRCYIADGYDVSQADVLSWPLSKKTVRYLTFEDASAMSRVRKNVAYCFSVNGEYVADPIAVRQVMGNLFAKYGYYAKIELMTQQLDRDKSAAAMDLFLRDAIPAVQQVLPDWSQYQGK